MIRRRNSNSSNGTRRTTNRDYSGPSFSDLPNNILVTILLSLSVKWIFVCKSVCKTWYDLISDPDFAKLHFNQAQEVYPLFRTSGFTMLSRMLYLVQPEQVGFERKLDMCYDHSSPIKIKLDTKLKLPLRNIQMILDKEGAEISKNVVIKLNMKNHKYTIVNSCNGLLCLSDPSNNNEPVIVCNPVTGEFINLPEVRAVNDDPKYARIDCDFGFSPETNQYKVIRTFWRRVDSYKKIVVAEVHTLGTDTWRALPNLPKKTYLVFATYLNGCVYWAADILQFYVISFDVEKECFESFSTPPPLDKCDMLDPKRLTNMGVLGGELFISILAYRVNQHGTIWVLKDDGANKSWSEMFSINTDDDDERWPYGSYQPIKYLNNGALLMFHSYQRALICKDPRKTGFRYLELRGFKSEFEVIAHIPSFVPLKHVLSKHNVKVLNINSRCAEFNLNGEGKGISIVEEDWNNME